jgi:hypothetical protein
LKAHFLTSEMADAAKQRSAKRLCRLVLDEKCDRGQTCADWHPVDLRVAQAEVKAKGRMHVCWHYPGCKNSECTFLHLHLLPKKPWRRAPEATDSEEASGDAGKPKAAAPPKPHSSCDKAGNETRFALQRIGRHYSVLEETYAGYQQITARLVRETPVYAMNMQAAQKVRTFQLQASSWILSLEKTLRELLVNTGLDRNEPAPSTRACLEAVAKLKASGLVTAPTEPLPDVPPGFAQLALDAPAVGTPAATLVDTPAVDITLVSTPVATLVDTPAVDITLVSTPAATLVDTPVIEPVEVVPFPVVSDVPL